MWFNCGLRKWSHVYLKWLSCFLSVWSHCFLWTFNSCTHRLSLKRMIITAALSRMLRLCWHWCARNSSIGRVRTRCCIYIYIYIYICMCLPILCSYVLLMLIGICSHALMTHPLWWTQVNALAALKPMALAFLQVCCNGLIPSRLLVDALRHGVEAGLLNIGFVLEA